MSSTGFDGFPKQALTFLKDINANNNREWFAAHKQDYIDTVRQPALAFIATLGERLREKISPDIIYDLRTNGAGSLLRIYRDTRFSKDKTPYKTNVGIIFWEGSGKKMENPGFYFGFDKNSGSAHAGYYGFTKPMLAAYREAVDADRQGQKLEKALKKVRQAGYEINSPHYKRVPRGYEADHPRADLLKHDELYGSSPPITPAQITSSDLVDVVFEHCRKMAPIHRWLVEVVSSI